MIYIFRAGGKGLLRTGAASLTHGFYTVNFLMLQKYEKSRPFRAGIIRLARKVSVTDRVVGDRIVAMHAAKRGGDSGDEGADEE